MLTLGLVCAKISAGAGYAILLRRRLGRFWRLVEAGGGCSAPSQPPQPPDPPQPPLAKQRQRRRHEGRRKQRHRRPPCPHARRRQGTERVEHRGMPEATARQEEHEPAPDVPAEPQTAERDDHEPKAEGHALVPPRQPRIQDVPAVQLAHGQQVEHGHEHPDPTSKRERTDDDGLRAVMEQMARDERDRRVAQDPGLGSHGSNRPVAAPCPGAAWLWANPSNSTGSATRNPAIGPHTPMSNSCRRSLRIERRRMNAPIVPMKVGNNGTGMKYGGETSTS